MGLLLHFFFSGFVGGLLAVDVSLPVFFFFFSFLAGAGDGDGDGFGNGVRDCVWCLEGGMALGGLFGGWGGWKERVGNVG